MTEATVTDAAAAHSANRRTAIDLLNLFLEGVLHLFAGVLQAGLRLVAPALVLGVIIAGGLADGFLGPAAQIFEAAVSRE